MALPSLESVEPRIERAVARLYGWLRTNRVTRTPWAVIQVFSDAQGALLSGSMAYYTFLSLLPLLMVTGFVLGTILHSSEAAHVALSDAVSRISPGLKGDELLNQLINARVALGVVGLITVGYAGSGFVGALTACMNRMWRVPTGRNPVGQKIFNIAIVMLLGIVLLGSVGLTIWITYLAHLAFGGGANLVADLLSYVASPLSLFGVLLLMYRLLPARRATWRSQVPGAVIGAIGVEILKQAFTLWASHSAGVSILPRSVLSVVLLLVWLGFFGQVILYGAAYNVVRDRRRRGMPLFAPQ